MKFIGLSWGTLIESFSNVWKVRYPLGSSYLFLGVAINFFFKEKHLIKMKE